MKQRYTPYCIILPLLLALPTLAANTNELDVLDAGGGRIANATRAADAAMHQAGGPIHNNSYAAHVGFAGCLITPLAPPAPVAPLFDDWLYEMEIQFTNYPAGTDLTNFPALVVFDTNRVDYTTFKTWGEDLRFTDGSRTTELNYEIENWHVGGTSYTWVQVPRLTNNCRIWAFWGEPSATKPAYTTNGATWSEGYDGVWHHDGPWTETLDSTSNRNNGVVQGADLADGIVSRARSFDGVWKRIETPLNINQSSGSPGVTLSAWVRPASTSGGRHDILGTDNGGFDWSLLREDNRWSVLTGSSHWRSAQPVDANVWQHVAAVFRPGTGITVHKNGVGDTTTTIAYDTSDYNVNIGRNPGYGEYFDGIIDEARVSRVSRSAEWIRAAYLNVASNDATTFHGQPTTEAPHVRNGEPTDITTSSASLNGYLLSTGQAPTTVYAYWAQADYGTNSSAWIAGGDWSDLGSPAAGPLSLPVSGLNADSTYYCTYHAVNGLGASWPDSSESFITGDVTIRKTLDASEGGPDDGEFTVYRPSAAAVSDLEVRFAVTGGTAGEGSDYTLVPSGAVTISAGSTSAVITVDVIDDYRNLESDETVEVTLLAGPYAIGSPSNATVTITNVFESPWVTYVDRDATGANNGTSWTNAYTSLAVALRAVAGNTFWVAEGVYTSDVVSSYGFEISPSRIYCGFAGWEYDLTQRDWSNNVVVLTGDLGGGSKAAHVVIKDSTGPARLDGCTVRDGNASGNYGGGLYCTTGDLVVANSTFTANGAWRGAAAYLSGSGDIVLTNCTFMGNTASEGGAVYAEQLASLSAHDCLFSNCVASGGKGGGVLYRDMTRDAVAFDGCRFLANQASSSGGAIGNSTPNGALLRITGCAFAGNKATYGGSVHSEECDVEVTDCAFTNQYGWQGGNLDIYKGDLTVAGSVFTNNTSFADGGAIRLRDACDVLVSNCTFVANVTSNYYGGAIAHSDGSGTMTILDCTFSTNRAPGDKGGAVWKRWGALTMDRCRFVNNVARNYGAALGRETPSPTTVRNCEFTGNRSSQNVGTYGGAIMIQDGVCSFSNCGFTNNVSGQSGGAVHFYQYVDSVTLSNCTFTGNSAPGLGGAVDVQRYVPLNVRNSTFHSNLAGQYGGAIHHQSNMDLRDCSFEANRVTGNGNGGAIRIYNGWGPITASVVNCNFVSNRLNNGSGGTLWMEGVSDITFGNSDLVNSTAPNGQGGALYVTSYQQMTMSNCTVSGNSCGLYGGGMLISGGQMLTVSDSTFSSNKAPYWGGGATLLGAAACSFERCDFLGNKSHNHGGGLFLDNTGATNTFQNCLFADNRATNSSYRGGGVYVNSPANIYNWLNCTFVTNRADDGGAMALRDSAATFTNCIFYSDDASDQGDEIYLAGGGPAVRFGYCNIDTSRIGGSTGRVVLGPGMTNVPPLFVNVDAYDLHLQSREGHWTAGGWIPDAADSPCIDAGDTNMTVAAEPPPHGDRINLGRYGGTDQASKTWLPYPNGSLFKFR